jgi:hypothetical protein
MNTLIIIYSKYKRTGKERTEGRKRKKERKEG